MAARLLPRRTSPRMNSACPFHLNRRAASALHISTGGKLRAEPSGADALRRDRRKARRLSEERRVRLEPQARPSHRVKRQRLPARIRPTCLPVPISLRPARVDIARVKVLLARQNEQSRWEAHSLPTPIWQLDHVDICRQPHLRRALVHRDVRHESVAERRARAARSSSRLFAWRRTFCSDLTMCSMSS